MDVWKCGWYIDIRLYGCQYSFRHRVEVTIGANSPYLVRHRYPEARVEGLGSVLTSAFGRLRDIESHAFLHNIYYIFVQTSVASLHLFKVIQIVFVAQWLMDKLVLHRICTLFIPMTSPNQQRKKNHLQYPCERPPELYGADLRPRVYLYLYFAALHYS